MNNTTIMGIYDANQNEKKQVCLKVCLPYALKYLTNLKLIYESKPEKHDEIQETNLNQIVPDKLYCYSCNIKFNDYHEMRKHQWNRTHQIKSGLITVTNESFLDDNEDSDENVEDDVILEEETEVDNDNDPDSDEERMPNVMENIEKSIDNFNIDFISDLRTGNISFNEVCSFPTIYFQNETNEIIGINRCILFNKKNKPENPNELMVCVNKLLNCQKFAVFLYSGGRFSGAVFDGNKAVLHRTIKRYTYRRKQGGSQTTKDNQGQFCRSGGAYLRRINTSKLIDDVFNLLHQAWAPAIAECGLILVWSAKSQRRIFGHESMLNQSRNKLSFDVNKDPRVRFISARVSQVNSGTLIDVYRQVSTIEVYDACSIAKFVMPRNSTITPESTPISIEQELHPTVPIIKKKSKQKRNACDKPLNGTIIETKQQHKDQDNCDANQSDEQESKEDYEVRTRMLNYVLNDSVEDLVPYLDDLRVSKSCHELSRLLSVPLKTKNQTLLHLAIVHNNISVIPPLLNYGCNPLHRNTENETPYAQAIRQRNQIACSVMSDFMFKNPTMYDYHAAKFPGGKDPLKEEERRKQLAEKKKQHKKDRKQKLKLVEEERKKEAFEKCQRDQFLALDNISKISYLKQVERDQKRFRLCFQCALNISEIVPFSYSDYFFCGMDCLKKHRFANGK